jgi:hypothetical protein
MNIIPERMKATYKLWLFGLWKVPLIFYVRPSVASISEDKIVVKIPFKRRNKNHVRSMYFGTMCVGADCSGGLLAMKFIEKHPEHISLIFKDCRADFLKRAEGDTYFSCEQGRVIKELVELASQSEDRVEMPIAITARVPDKFGDEPVAIFEMTLSLRRK